MNKKIFLFLFMMIFLVGIVSAYVLPSKSYDEKIKEIKIYDWNFIGKIFDVKLADIKLTNNSYYCFTDCYAEGIITSYFDGKIIEDVFFKNLNINKDTNLDHKLFIQNGTIKKTIKENSCYIEKEKQFVNGTYQDIQVCSVIDKQIDVPNWEEYYGEILR